MNKRKVLKHNKTILHIIRNDKFIPRFIDFMEEHISDFGRHVFFIFGDTNQYQIRRRPNVLIVSELKKSMRAINLIRYMARAEKIILHGLFIDQITLLLAFQSWLLKKCYWIIWGGDLYRYRNRYSIWNPRLFIYEVLHAFVIKRVGHLVTYMKGEYESAVKIYGAKGEYHECFTYPSNLYRQIVCESRKNSTINIQIGNSATETNQHIEILGMLSEIKDCDIRLFLPLSYGDEDYAKKVIAYGKSVFNDKFVPMTDFLPFDEYINFQSQVDIAIFNHDRQQAFGNTIALLGMGKKVYMNKETTSWRALRGLGLNIFDIKQFDLTPISSVLAEENRNIISKYFSEDNLTLQLGGIFANRQPEPEKLSEL